MMCVCCLILLLMAVIAIGSMFCKPLDELAEMDNETLLKLYHEMKVHVGNPKEPRPFNPSDVLAEIKKRGLPLND